MSRKTRNPRNPLFPNNRSVMGTKGIPSDTFGDDGDLAIDGDDGRIYVKVAGAWTSVGPKVWRGLILQSGTNAPIVNVLENSLGDLSWAYGGSTGKLVGTLTDGFIEGTIVQCAADEVNGTAKHVIGGVSDINTVVVQGYNFSGVPTAVGTNCFVQIYVWS